MSVSEQWEAVVDEGLGNSAYLLDLGDGRALAVDPPRDLRALRRVAQRRGLKIAYAADTHLHADFLTGAVQLAATDGAQILASAGGRRLFEHRGLHDGDEIDLGGLTLQACSAPPGSARTSTIGAELAANSLLAAPDAETFTRLITAQLGSYPAYFARLAELNRRGPEVITGQPVLATLSVDEVRARLAEGAVVIDVRPIADVAQGHLPGAVSIALRPQFATWLGWVIDPGAPIVIVRNEDQNPAEILWPAYNIGYTRFLGELAGGVAAWKAAGQPLVATELTAPAAVSGHVLDVRQDDEYLAGHLPHAIHIELGALAHNRGNTGTGQVTVMCAHGNRAMTGATLLQRNGARHVSVFDGGAGEWAAATGNPLETGP